ncbi:YgfZ/GcvT domain-containing protein [Rothia sp. P7208]|uniref:CAF17-like 4Fe-4S cluster assembly/insertion protein YgfZ n=1 Tax=Rothia sp. P7208 TaxID=3402660 RepID=UPI003AD42773
MSEYLSPLHQAYGVFAGSGVDAPVAAHYGDPIREQRRISLGAERHVIADYSHLGVVTVGGSDRHRWLSSLSSQELSGLSAHHSTELLLLSPQGRIEYAPYVLEDGEKLWLICEPKQNQPLTEYLNSMKFMLDVTVSDVSEDYAVLCSWDDPRTNTQAPEALSKAPCWEDPWHSVCVGGVSYTEIDAQEHPACDYQRFMSIIPREELLDIASACELVGMWAAEALRIEAWRPRYATEVDHKSIPHELDYLRSAVHLSKGCYKGQETVARVHNLGHPPRRLVFLDLDGSEHTLPTVGAGVYFNTRKVGVITSVAQHWEAGPIALAVIKRSVDPQAPLRVVDELEGAGEVHYAAAQTVIVSADAGQAVGRQERRQFLRREE